MLLNDEILDMELEEVWEVQRSKSRAQENRNKGKSKKKTAGSDNRNHGRNHSKSKNNNAKEKREQYSSPARRLPPRRSMSTGRIGEKPRNKSRGDERKTKSVRNYPFKNEDHRGNDKRVSISKYVEKIEIPPTHKRNSIAPPIQRRGRSRNDQKTDKSRNLRSRSMTENKNRFNAFPVYDSYDEDSYEETKKKAWKKKGFFGFRKRRKDKRDDIEDDYVSSSSDSYYSDDSRSDANKMGFFSAFR